MMDSDDDEIYPTNEASNGPKVKIEDDAEEEGEEVEDDSDVYSPPEDSSEAPADDIQEDINFITDAKEEPKLEPKSYVVRLQGKNSSNRNMQAAQTATATGVGNAAIGVNTTSVFVTTLTATATNLAIRRHRDQARPRRRRCTRTTRPPYLQDRPQRKSHTPLHW